MQQPQDLQRLQTVQRSKNGPTPISALLTSQPRICTRRPVRISVTVSQLVHDALIARSVAEGRSLSNLAAFLLESSLTPETPPVFTTLPQAGRLLALDPAPRIEA